MTDRAQIAALGAHLAAVALRDCGPSGPGARVIDHLPATLSPDARAVCVARLAYGAEHYGAPLALGWEPAVVEAVQEAADLVHYLIAARARPELIECAAALLNAIMADGVQP